MTRQGRSRRKRCLCKSLPALGSLFLRFCLPRIHRRHICRFRWLRDRGRGRLWRPGSLLFTLGIGGSGAPGARSRPDIRLHAKACPAEHGGARGPGEAAPRPLSAPSPGCCPERSLRTTLLPQSHTTSRTDSYRSFTLPPPPRISRRRPLCVGFLFPPSDWREGFASGVSPRTPEGRAISSVQARSVALMPLGCD